MGRTVSSALKIPPPTIGPAGLIGVAFCRVYQDDVEAAATLQMTCRRGDAGRAGPDDQDVAGCAGGCIRRMAALGKAGSQVREIISGLLRRLQRGVRAKLRGLRQCQSIAPRSGPAECQNRLGKVFNRLLEEHDIALGNADATTGTCRNSRPAPSAARQTLSADGWASSSPSGRAEGSPEAEAGKFIDVVDPIWGKTLMLVSSLLMSMAVPPQDAWARALPRDVAIRWQPCRRAWRREQDRLPAACSERCQSRGGAEAHKPPAKTEKGWRAANQRAVNARLVGT